MNIIKTPKEMLLEMAGVPSLAKGGKAAPKKKKKKKTQDMLHEMIAHGKTPSKLKPKK